MSDTLKRALPGAVNSPCSAYLVSTVPWTGLVIRLLSSWSSIWAICYQQFGLRRQLLFEHGQLRLDIVYLLLVGCVELDQVTEAGKFSFLGGDLLF